jgi:hypothetical protein
MRPSQDYSITKRSCYLGFVTQAIVANFTPLLCTLTIQVNQL